MEIKIKSKLEYCFAREKEIVIAQQKQSVPVSINQFVEMTVFLCLICFSIYDKMQGFLDEWFVYFFIYLLIFFAFYAEIQNGHQKWQESPRVKNFVEIALSCSISEINGFLRFTQKFKMGAKSVGKTICEKSSVESADTMRVKDFIEIALSRFDFRDKQAFAFNAEIQDGCQKLDTLWVKNFLEIALSCSFPR